MRSGHTHDDTRRDHDPSNTKASNHQHSPHLVHIIRPRDRHGAHTRSHQRRRHNHDHPIGALEQRQHEQPQHCADHQRQTNGDRADAGLDGVVPVDVVGLGRPEGEQRDEVGAGDAGDDEGEDQDAGRLVDAAWEHWEFGEARFPDDEGDDQDGAEEEGEENVDGGPGVGVAAPLHASHCTRACEHGFESSTEDASWGEKNLLKRTRPETLNKPPTKSICLMISRRLSPLGFVRGGGK